MVRLNKKQKLLVLIILIISVQVIFLESCHKDGLVKIDNNIQLFSKLSDYNIFQGTPSNLSPSTGFHLFELNTQLFTDYAEKQRLIKIPIGTKMTAINNGLLDFPDGTIIVKTFFYYNDQRDTSKGKNIIETRLLIKSGATWNAGTYLWNDSQTEGKLITIGLNKSINWIDSEGNSNVISYHVPAKNECNTCHQSNNRIIPIGPKVRNLNRDVFRFNSNVNQLQYFYNSGLINQVDPADFTVLPNWQTPSFSIEQRTRAYMDVNCAHCHNPHGSAADHHLSLDFEIPLEETGIKKEKTAIIGLFEHGFMPKLGTTLVDKQALELIKSYINNL